MSLDHTNADIPPGYRIERIVAGKSRRLRVRFPDGSTTGAISSEDIALQKIDKHVAESRKRERACMTCGGQFISAGPGHRMCDRCRYEQREWNGV